MKKKKKESFVSDERIAAQPREIIAAQRLSVNTVKETAASTQTTATVKTIDI